MGYKKKDLEEMALEAIKKHGLIWISEIVSFLPCSSSTFYNHKLEQLDSIKDALNAGRVTTKVKLRKNWAKSDNATKEIALYKLLANDEELKRLSVDKGNDSKDEKPIQIENRSGGLDE